MFTYTNFYRIIFLFLVHDAVPPSPARSITKQPTALLSLSKTYEFYDKAHAQCSLSLSLFVCNN